ncbi:MAG: transglycosylase SLT domain-containing protein [Bacteroidota bacterium]|nr:transglycosylase SLT domain-containing protein [Bacteroidota bacterium]
MKRIAGLLLLLVACLASGCSGKGQGHDFPEILQGDTLRVITLNSSTSYFIYRDQPMGYHYDMIRDFCQHHGLVPHVEAADNVPAMLRMLHEGEGDVIAYGLPVTNTLKESVIYSGLKQVAHQVLVQRVKPTESMVTDVTQLIGQRVTLLAGSHYHERLTNLNRELGGGILLDVIENDTTAVEDLIRGVSDGSIEYTVADDDLARLNQTYFRNLDVHLQLSFDQRSSWAVRKDTPRLADSLDLWFQDTTTKPVFVSVMKRYFEEAKGYDPTDRVPFHSLLAPGVVSPYDIYFKQFGEQFNIDWRLLASVSYQESHFNPEGVSWAGAIGLMGLMPGTAASLGLETDALTNPAENIRAGAEYLRKLLNNFRSVESREERLKMALAAYNGGIGHVMDARALARKYGDDDSLWEGNVEKYIQLKRLEQYYTDPVSKSGYFRGDETVRYVRDVIDRWNIYKEKVKE